MDFMGSTPAAPGSPDTVGGSPIGPEAFATLLAVTCAAAFDRPTATSFERFHPGGDFTNGIVTLSTFLLIVDTWSDNVVSAIVRG